MVENDNQLNNSPETGSDSFEELVDTPESLEELVGDLSTEGDALSADAYDQKGAPETTSTGTSRVGDEGESARSTANNGADNIPQPGLEEMEQAVQSLKALLEERTTQYMRIAADFDNYRKRTQKEKEDLEVQIKCNTISELLPVVDNFERARAQLKPQTDQEMNIHKSYQGVYKQLVECLKRVGVSPMRSEGKEFDPNLHEAVMREATNEYPEGTVIEELVRGYLLGERVLRHAMVKVAAPADDSSDYSESSQASNG